MKTFFFALFLLSASVSAASAAEPISSVYTDAGDHLIAGEVITVWESTFLLEDGSGQVVVSVDPYTIEDLGLEGRDLVSLSGKMDGSIFKPLMLVSDKLGTVSFTTGAMLPEIPASVVKENTRRYSSH